LAFEIRPDRSAVSDNAIWTIGGSPAAGASHSSAGSIIIERFTRTAK
jgi:hypothetical protein